MAKLQLTFLLIISSLFILSQARVALTVIDNLASPSIDGAAEQTDVFRVVQPEPDHNQDAISLQVQDLSQRRFIGLGHRHFPTRFRCGGFRHRHHLHHHIRNDRHHGFRSYGNDGIFSGPGFHGNGFERRAMMPYAGHGHVAGGDEDKEQIYVDRAVQTGGQEEAGWMSKVRKFVDTFGF